jgi:hypothetical protein
MKERPILFSGSMVRAILSGVKFQTRRVVKPQPEWVEPETVWQQADGHSGPGWYAHNEDYPEEGSLFYRCPYGQPSDRLWVRENFCDVASEGSPRRLQEVMYRADGDTSRDVVPRWSPSIHMPRWASRITLEITDVRVERLQDISEEDAIAEGVKWFSSGAVECPGMPETPVDAYRSLWEKISGSGSWEKNPWVWCISFKRTEP